MNTTTDTETAVLPVQLSPIEARILGCLIEKQATTPDQYPLTLNALVVACNQKTNREPVMELETGAVGHAVRDLENRQLLRRQFSSRTDRIEHRFDQSLSLTSNQQALLSMMLLRGPQTMNELLIRCERLAKFSNLEDVRHTLDRLMALNPALVANIGRGHGQREDRYMHRFFGEPTAMEYQSGGSERSRETVRNGTLNVDVADLMHRIEALETTVAELQLALSALQTNR